MFKIILSLFFLFFKLSAQDCKSCHNVENFELKNHNFSCIECHVKPVDRTRGIEHKKIVANPASYKNMEIFCGKCHKENIKNFKNSNHATLKNMINITRKVWGVKDSNCSLMTLPKINNKDIKDVSELVDDFLRRKCLKCHIDNKGSGEKGMYRGKGCMSCHMKYSSDGKYKGKDSKLIGKKSHGIIHKMSKKPPMSACLSCHNKEFVGTDFLGLFPKDYHYSYRGPITKKGTFLNTKYGIDFQHLNIDVHRKKGFKCNSCHGSFQNNGKMVTKTCVSCHKNISDIEAHKSYHSKISCTACHSSWMGSHYEMSVFRDDIKDYNKWNKLTMQEDAYLQNFLEKNIGKKNQESPMMPDWVENKKHKGLWYSGWTFRRWENFLLGNADNGKIELLRPLFQYRVSFRDSKGRIIFNDLRFNKYNEKMEVFLPVKPHTIIKNAKNCEKCHENKNILDPYKKTDTVLDIFTGNTMKSKLLNYEQIRKMQSKKYKKVRAKMLNE